MLTPRGEQVLTTALADWIQEQSADPATAATIRSINLEQATGQTRTLLMKMGIRGAEDMARLPATSWQKLPASQYAHFQRCAATALATPQGPLATDGQGLQLRRPELTFGSGAPIRLVTNHFLLRIVAPPGGAVWQAWQVEFPTAPAEPRAAAGSGGSGGRASRVPAGPGRAVRTRGVQRLLGEQQVAEEDWLFDGGHRLYTRRGRAPQGLAVEHRVRLDDGRLPLPVAVQPATEDGGGGRQQELDVSRLAALRPDAGQDVLDGVREELRLLQVAMRSHAIGVQSLIAKGRRIVCPQGGLVDCDETSLRHGRQLWMGYLANLEVIDDGLGVGGVRCSLSLNYSASVGLPEMPAVDLLAHLLAEEWCRGRPNQRQEGFRYYQNEVWRAGDRWPRDLSDKLLHTLNSEMGLRKLRVKVDYFGHERRFTVVGVTTKPASKQMFWYEPEQREVSVAEYFKSKWGKELWCSGLPCLELNKRGNCVPIELVTVLGAEHNLTVGKLRPEYQKEVSRKTTVSPEQRQWNIQGIVTNDRQGPQPALLAKGVELQRSMLKVNGHCLQAPVLKGAGQAVTPNNYANTFKAVAPPDYNVPWGLWCFTEDRQQELWGLAATIKRSALAHGLWFEECSFVEYPRRSWQAIQSGESALALREALKQDLYNVMFGNASSALLFVLLPSDGRKDDIYKFVKVHTETELCSFATQCVITPPAGKGGKGKGGKGDLSGIQLVERKLNNIMVKIPGKLRLRQNSSDASAAEAAHNVRLDNPHWLLSSSTVVLGADVTHHAAGVSVAGVVATRGSDFSTYLSELRAQSPFVLGADKKRARKSEERILELTAMAASLLEKWRAANQDQLPETVLYYRDGVSDGQFKPVLTMELNQLAEAFKQVGGAQYEPKLVIIVGQKRHQTRFFLDNNEAGGGGGGGQGYGQSSGGWRGGGGGSGGGGKGRADGNGNVPPGTVAGRGIAQPGHLNFFLVSAQGIKGTSIPCHYHVLHADARLRVQASDLEQVVGYAAPAYYADHLCERGKLYLEAEFPESLDSAASSQPSSEEAEERRFREQVEERCKWFNSVQARVGSAGGSNLQGRNFFC